MAQTTRFTIVAYLLALVHVVGAGTNGTSTWMLALLTALTAPIVFAFTYRILPQSQRDRNGTSPHRGSLVVPRHLAAKSP